MAPDRRGEEAAVRRRRSAAPELVRRSEGALVARPYLGQRSGAKMREAARRLEAAARAAAAAPTVYHCAQCSMVR